MYSPIKVKLRPARIMLQLLLLSLGLHLVVMLLIGEVDVPRPIMMETTDCSFGEERLVIDHGAHSNAGLYAMEAQTTAIECFKKTATTLEPSSLRITPLPEMLPIQSHVLPPLADTSQASIDTVGLESVEMPGFVLPAGLADVRHDVSVINGFHSGGSSLQWTCDSCFRPERILLAVDARASDMAPSVWASIVMAEVDRMLRCLSDGTLLNVMVYDGKRVQFLNQELVPAGDTVVLEFGEWFDSLALDQAVGCLPQAAQIPLSLEASELQEAIVNDRSDVAYLLQLSVEAEVDAVFFLTDDALSFDGSAVAGRATLETYFSELIKASYQTLPMTNLSVNVIQVLNEEAEIDRREDGELSDFVSYFDGKLRYLRVP